MANPHYQKIFTLLKARYGEMRRIGKSYTLFHIPSIDTLFYFRYSKIHAPNTNRSWTFYGLSKEEIALMTGKKAFICFITDREEDNIFIPFHHYEQYFLSTLPSTGGQYKTNLYIKPTGREIYFTGIGKFKADSYANIDAILNLAKTGIAVPELSHTDVQTLLGSIGIAKGFSVWFPESDKQKIDLSIVDNRKIVEQIPSFGNEIDHIISEIDVIWFEQSRPVSFYEVEHSTPIYSGLLRFNDVLLTVAQTNNFNIVANNEREGKFTREVNRPTFKQNKLIEKVSFLNYEGVYQWHKNLTGNVYER